MSASFAKDQLRSIIERIERLDEETKALSDDKSDIYKEAKSNGFDTKALKEIIRIRRKEPGEREEFESLVDLYKQALGMLPADGTPVATRARPKTYADEMAEGRSSESIIREDRDAWPDRQSVSPAHDDLEIPPILRRVSA